MTTPFNAAFQPHVPYMPMYPAMPIVTQSQPLVGMAAHQFAQYQQYVAAQQAQFSAQPSSAPQGWPVVPPNANLIPPHAQYIPSATYNNYIPPTQQHNQQQQTYGQKSNVPPK